MNDLIDPFDNIKNAPAAMPMQTQEAARPEGLIDPFDHVRLESDAPKEQQTRYLKPGDVASNLTGMGTVFPIKPAEEKPQQVDPNAINKPANEAGFVTQSISALADTPQAKIKAFAAARFPDMPLNEAIKRYGVQDGKIVFSGDDGNIYAETQPGAIPSLLGKHPVVAGSVIGGVYGSKAGPVGAIIGAGLGGAAGEAARYQIAHTALGEQKTAGELALDVGIEGALSAGGQGIGEVIASRVARNVAQSNGPKIFDKMAEQSQQEADHLKLGTLSKAEATGGREAIDQEKALRGLPGGRDVFQEADKIKSPKIRDAVHETLDLISPERNIPNAAQGIRDASRSVIKTAEDVRLKEAQPYYQAAESERLQPSNFNKLKSDSFFAKKIDEVRGDPLFEKELAGFPDNSIKVLNEVKLKIDADIRAAKSDPAQKNRVRVLMQKKEQLTGIMDEASDNYKMGRSIYEYDSPSVTKFQYGIVGKIAGTKDTQLKTVTSIIFDPKESNPQVLRQAKQSISAADPEAWNAITRLYLQQQFEGMAQATGEGINLGAAFAKKVMGTPKQRQMLFTALEDNPEALKNVTYMSRVFPRIGVASFEGSPTAVRTELIKNMKNSNAYSKAQAVSEFDITKPFQMLSKSLGRKADEASADIYHAMAEAAANPKYAKDMAEIRTLDPKGQKSIAAFTNLISQIVTETASTTTDWLPPQEIPLRQKNAR